MQSLGSPRPCKGFSPALSSLTGWQLGELCVGLERRSRSPVTVQLQPPGRTLPCCMSAMHQSVPNTTISPAAGHTQSHARQVQQLQPVRKVSCCGPMSARVQRTGAPMSAALPNRPPKLCPAPPCTEPLDSYPYPPYMHARARTTTHRPSFPARCLQVHDALMGLLLFAAAGSLHTSRACWRTTTRTRCLSWCTRCCAPWCCPGCGGRAWSPSS